ncbi:hypothetical protein L6164_021871 [Bauhinia variegata]|uniref:Uncharacterized protein n=1 Tax=Bauhinia variegata TaxID=167791 RepID=A0ACB9MER2_BAUVA|nr:hypothetical protein L6164_021871 [Bauhinia variegata]
MAETDSVQMQGSTGTSANLRWNPTKEQISMLESLYMQGIRTPSADQIQQITARLQAYGHIEGKNVFYWFQNHKARQRQKQKQETIAYFNHFLRRSPPIFSTPLCPNVICSPYYMPQQHPKVLLPGSGVCRRRPMTDKVMPMENPIYYDAPLVRDDQHVHSRIAFNNYMSHSKYLETLPLFPIHPTGILESKTLMDQASPIAVVKSVATPSSGSSSDNIDVDGAGQLGDKPFFDFLSETRSS